MTETESKVSFFQAIAISFGAIIGWGAYVMPGDLFLSKGTLLSSSLAIIVGTILIYIIAQSYVNLLSITPDEESGGIFWIYRYLSKNHAFIYGWGMLLGYVSIVALNISAIPLLISYLLPDYFRIKYIYSVSSWDIYISDIAICSCVLIVFLYVNYKGIKKGAKIQSLFAMLMVFSVLFLFLGSFLNSSGSVSVVEINSHVFTDLIEDYSWLSIIAVIPWAFVGFETTPQISKDIKSSKYKSKLIISISIFVGLIFYLMINYFTALNMSFNYNNISQSLWATGEGIKQKLGILGMFVLSIAMIFSILSGVNGFILSSIKLLESMNKFNLLPSYLLEKNFLSNKKSIVFIFILCIWVPWLGRNVLLDIVSVASIGISVGFLYVTLSDIKSQYVIYGKVIKKLSYLAFLISIIFVFLLLTPGSPAVLSSRALLFLIFFLIVSIGMLGIKKIIKRY